MESLEYLIRTVDSIIRNPSVKNVGEQMGHLEYGYLRYQLESAGKRIFARDDEFAVADTKTLAAEVLNESLRQINRWYSESGNIDHMRAAMEDVGTSLLASAFEKRKGQWVRVRSIQNDGVVLDHDPMREELAQKELETSHV